MITYLLDVNLLLALIDPRHIHHDTAHHWFAKKGHRSWATCPLTQNGFVRVASHPSYPNRPGDVPIVLAMLQQLCAEQGHQFWSEDISILDMLESDVLITHTQISDIYLLGLAAHKGGKLATLDQRIPAFAVKNGQQALEVLAP